MNKENRKSWLLLAIAVVVIVGGSLLGWWINQGAGTVTVKDTSYVGTNAFLYHARLYVPEGVTNEKPAPGVVVIHGGDASNEYMANIALELARRNFVALAIDQSGAGFSDAPSYVNGMGGPDALKYIRSLDIVDTSNVGLVGHSMGGAALSNAIKVYPDDYAALVFLDTRCELGPAMPCDFPVRNAMVNWGLFEEHPLFFYGVPKNEMVPDSPALQTLFGMNERVEPGVLYGSIEDGTAHMLRLTNDTHLTVVDSATAIGNIVDWFQLTLEGEKSLPPADQIWGWKDLGTFSALLGTLLLMFPMGALLLQTPYFKKITDAVPDYKGFQGRAWWIAAAVTTVLAPITYVIGWDYLRRLPGLTPNAIWPQSQTNAYYLGWALLLGSLTLILILVNHFAITKKNGATAFNYGLTAKDGKIEWGKIGRSLLFALAILVPVYLILVLVTSLLNIDFRLNFLALKIMTPLRFQIFLGYVIPFVLYYLLFVTMLHGFLRIGNGAASVAKEMWVNVLVMVSGMFAWVVIWYITLYANGTPFYGADSNFGIRVLPLMIIWPFIALITTYFFRKTGRVYAGGFLAGIFITWYLAANSMISVLP